MLFALQWDFEAYSEGCKAQFGVTPDPYWVETLYGGKNISSHSNIIFRYYASNSAPHTPC